MSLKYRLDKRNKESKLYSAVNPTRLDVQADLSGPSMTRQEFTEECDINMIMARYEKGGVFAFNTKNDGIYYDFVGMPDLAGAMQDMIQAEEAFMRLPAIVRKEFDNDPLRFVEFAQDGNNVAKMREWGLAEPEKAPEKPMRVEVVSPPIAPAAAPAAPGA